MKLKSVNKILTTVLSVSMLMGSTMPVLAAEDGAVDVEAPIYSLDIVDVIVPTSYAVAFNPDGLTVKTDDTTGTSTAQVLSKNYGIINKSSKDKVITVKLNIEDQNADSGITFVDSAQDITDAVDGEYKIHLTAIPADTTEVKVGSASATQTTAATDLNNVAMAGATSNAVTLKGGENYLGFKLEKAVWEPKTGSEPTLGTTKSNDVSANFEVKSLATGGKGITAFTFDGAMNKKADWSKLTKGIKISVVYGNETAASDLAAISGTGAMVAPNIAPTFSTGKGIGQIKYSAGVGDNGLKEIKKVELDLSGTPCDGYNDGGRAWPAATNESGVITFASQFIAYWKTGDYIDGTVTYETNSGAEKTATVKVKRVINDAPPVFTTGSGVGQINYTMGAGDEALKKILKVELDLSGAPCDGYNDAGTSWPGATDESGVITFASKFISYWKSMATTEATVTYETVEGVVRTATVDVKCQ